MAKVRETLFPSFVYPKVYIQVDLLKSAEFSSEYLRQWLRMVFKYSKAVFLQKPIVVVKGFSFLAGLKKRAL